MQEFKILASIKSKDSTLKIRLAGLTTNYKSPVYIYLVPGNESISFQLNSPPSEVQFKIYPFVGESLDYFNYSIQNLQPGNNFSIYYYFEIYILQIDVIQQSIDYGIPLVINSQELTGSFQLPNGIVDDAISILCQIESSKGSKSYLVQYIQVNRKNYQINKLYQAFNNQTNFSNLQSIHTMTKLMEIEQQQVCLKQCSGVGTCFDKKCKCPPEYYFDDCSGTLQEHNNFSNLILNALQQLIKIPITNDDEFRLFSQSLLYLSTLIDLNNTITNLDCQQILEQYIQNLNSRLQKINQYSINLQYQSTTYLNYSQIDIRSFKNQNDLHTALKSTVIMWAITLFTQDSAVYQLQSRLKDFLSAIIELSLFGIELNESIDYSFDIAFLKIQRVSNISNITKERILVETTGNHFSDSEYYDVVQAIYIRNYFSFDGYYPYPLQLYPLYDYQIRQQNRKQNILLSTYISYKFKALNDTTNLVCLMRNSQTYEWSNHNCTLHELNTSYFCNCTTLAPTTICNDYDYLYLRSPQFQLKIPNLLYIIYFAQLIILGIFFIQAGKSQRDKSIDNNKFGQVMKLAKRSKAAIQGNKIIPIEDEVREMQLKHRLRQTTQLIISDPLASISFVKTIKTTHKQGINCMVQFDDDFIATGSNDRTVKIYRYRVYELFKEIQFKSDVTSLAVQVRKDFRLNSQKLVKYIFYLTKLSSNCQIIQKIYGEGFCLYSKATSLFDNFIFQPIHSSKKIYNITFIKAQRIAFVQFAIQQMVFQVMDRSSNHLTKLKEQMKARIS
ncbi:unnamed protein product (macronuclear) [Paramecium tetraurelia]|uniref:EGF-like domain-containing protein n=1 Tax=Paramecium tetraurelia TaxID=5888 RepID=A0DF33_PARTE|nr:uncharacterized protein GSPATT00039468001 [Paramecium tetraurelia]CAK81650.1 unnamed protein product [Paramecium tetraurelia]|eukprot:XP_001449047.1 hypothetical protein (macronuclear) [Paramecium tetraurelia strain d4-2]